MNSYNDNRIGDVMANVLVPNVVDRGFEPRSGQTRLFNLVYVASMHH